MVTAFKIRNSEIEAFQHPETLQIIEVAEKYNERKSVCKMLFGKYPLDCFKFRNQSWTMIGNDLMDLLMGKVPLKSYHIQEDIEIIDAFHTAPLIQTLKPDHIYNKRTCIGADIRKSYSNAVMNMEDNYPVFSICDAFQKYKNGNIQTGEYLCDAFDIPQLGGVHFPRQILSHNVVKYLLNNKYMTKDKIMLEKKASYFIKKETFANFFVELRKIFPEPEKNKLDYFKIIANWFPWKKV